MADSLASILSRKKGVKIASLAAATVAVRARAVTRAAEDKEKGYDNKPDPLVFEDIAKTVIHNKSSVVYCLKRLRSSISYYEGFRFLVTKFNT